MYQDVERSVSDGAWKLIRYYRSSDQIAGSDRSQLFHLTDDPWEMHDLSSDPAQQERLRRMAEEMAAWQRRTGDFLASQSSPASPSVK